MYKGRRFANFKTDSRKVCSNADMDVCHLTTNIMYSDLMECKHGKTDSEIILISGIDEFVSNINISSPAILLL